MSRTWEVAELDLICSGCGKTIWEGRVYLQTPLHDFCRECANEDAWEDEDDDA